MDDNPYCWWRDVVLVEREGREINRRDGDDEKALCEFLPVAIGSG